LKSLAWWSRRRRCAGGFERRISAAAESERGLGDTAGRQLAWTLAERPEAFRFLIRDWDQKVNDSFDEVFEAVGSRSSALRFARPQANGVAARFVRTFRSEYRDRLLVLNAAS
jgi:hypothetical protein